MFKNQAVKFIFIFISLFAFFYFFNLIFFGLTSPEGNHYNAFLASHLNYIHCLRSALLASTKQILTWLGYSAITNEYEILVAGKGTLKLIYSCLGLGLISFFSAFVIAYPKKLKLKIFFLVAGILVIEILNVIRFVVLAIFWDKNEDTQIVDHHTLFNILMYVVIGISIYFWIKHDDKISIGHAKN